jgi:hypothetical protein
MSRPPRKSVTPLARRQEEIAHRESELRERVERLERMIADGPRIAAETSRREVEERRMKASFDDRRLRVSVARDVAIPQRRRSLRKERREGRIVFLVLVIALAAVVIWLTSHVHF